MLIMIRNNILNASFMLMIALRVVSPGTELHGKLVSYSRMLIVKLVAYMIHANIANTLIIHIHNSTHPIIQ